MSLLSGEELAEMQAFAQGQEPEAAAEPEKAEETPEAEAKAPEEGEQKQEQPEPEPSAPEKPRQHTVPYERLQQTIRQRNEAQRQLVEMQQTVAKLQAQIQQRSAVQDQVRRELVQQGLMDPETGHVDQQDHGNPQVQQLIGHLQAQQQAIESLKLAQETQALTRELAEVQQKFPMVPREFLLRGVASDPNADLDELADQFMSWVTPHLPQKAATPAAPPPARVQTPSAPPRPAKAGAASSQNSASAGQKGWGDRKDRTSAVTAMLAEMGWKN